jgi:hypothetical protein
MRSVALAAFLPFMLKLLPMPRVLSMLEPKKRSLEPLFSADQLARIANAVARYGPRFGVGPCLIRSLVLYNLLRRFAYDPVLLIGGTLSGSALASHSWIEVNGEPVGESIDPKHAFNVLYRYGDFKLYG